MRNWEEFSNAAATTSTVRICKVIENFKSRTVQCGKINWSALLATLIKYLPKTTIRIFFQNLEFIFIKKLSINVI